MLCRCARQDRTPLIQLNAYFGGRSKHLRRAGTVLMLSFVTACSSVSVRVPATVQSTPDCAKDARLEVNQICKLRVDADKACVPLDIGILKGDRYKIEVSPNQFWKDWTRPESSPTTGEAGSWFMNLFGLFKRMPEEPWMVLGMSRSTCSVRSNTDVACVSTDVRIGQESTIVDVDEPLMFSFFANDVPALNWNNQGFVWVNVTRLQKQ